jgi:hypothetical protein
MSLCLRPFRKFERLRLLNLEGNPVCKEAEYRMMVLAFLNQLKYLDYSMVQRDEIIAAREQFQVRTPACPHFPVPPSEAASRACSRS